MHEKKAEYKKGYINVLAVFIAFIMGLTLGRVDIDSVIKAYVERTSTGAVSRESIADVNEDDITEGKTKAAETTTVAKTQTSAELQSEVQSETYAYEQTTLRVTEYVYTYEDDSAQLNTEIQPPVTENATTENATTENATTEITTTEITTTKITTTATTGKTQSQASTQAKNGEVLYRTPTGKKFHVKPGCAGERRIETTYDEAVSLGLTPCGVCAKAYR